MTENRKFIITTPYGAFEYNADDHKFLITDIGLEIFEWRTKRTKAIFTKWDMFQNLPDVQ